MHVPFLNIALPLDRTVTSATLKLDLINRGLSFPRNLVYTIDEETIVYRSIMNPTSTSTSYLPGAGMGGSYARRTPLPAA